jgi:hypothetical protein
MNVEISRGGHLFSDAGSWDPKVTDKSVKELISTDIYGVTGKMPKYEVVGWKLKNKDT